MKKNLWIWALAALSIAACTDEDMPTQQQQVVTENDWISPDGQVVVQLSADGLPVPSVSMGRAIGKGPIENTDIVELDSLGIFALNRTGGFEPVRNDNNAILLNNVRAKGTDDATLDTTIHKAGDKALKRIRLFSENNTSNTVGSVFYYPILPTNNYDFYGYFPRQNTVEYTNDSVKVTFAATDGSVDIITGKAEQAPVMQANTLYAGKEWNDEQDDSIKVFNTLSLDGYNSRYIRSIKYHNWLMETNEIDYPAIASYKKQPFVPNIKFKHKLALLKFYIVANHKQSGAPEPPYNDRLETTELRVFDLTLDSVHTVAQWNVTKDTLLWNVQGVEQYANLGIHRLDTLDNLVWSKDTVVIDEVETPKNTMIPAATKEVAQEAGYLLVEPKAGYKVSLCVLAPKDNEGDAVPQWQKTTLTIPNTFLAGHKYKVYIQLNAFQEVNVNAQLEDWVDGDDVFIPVE